MLFGLSALSFSFRCGLIGRGTSRAVLNPLGIEALIALTARAGLRSLEFPLVMLADHSPQTLAGLRDRLARSGLTPVLQHDVITADGFAHVLTTAVTLGARTVRILASPVREGARTGFTPDWQAYLEQVITQLRQVVPQAEAQGINLALENHQDVTTNDLLQIIEAVASPTVGITFDAVNTLAVAEDPLVSLSRLEPHIRNIHLADYLAYPSQEGWRMVRCALGEGDLNLRRLLALLADLPPTTTCQIELSSHTARHIRLLTDEWWEGYPPHDARRVLPVLREFVAPGRSYDADWRTPWERGAPEEQIALYEDQQYAASLNYLRSLGVLTHRQLSA